MNFVAKSSWTQVFNELRIFYLMGLSGTPVSCLTFVLKCGCVQNKRAGTPCGFSKSTTWYKSKHNNTNGNNWFAGARWRMYHVTWARLWNEEKREIMKSRLVEQHWAFTPLPHSSLWRACVVSLPVFCFFFVWSYWEPFCLESSE